MATLVKWTVADYHRMIEAGILADRRVELLNGEIVEMPAEGAPHTSRVSEGANHFRALLADKAFIREAHPITLETSEPEPDIAIVQLPFEQYRDRHPYPSDIYWLIEISYATRAKDFGEKQQIYAAAGIPEYWILDLRNKELVVLREPAGDRYQHRQALTVGSIAPLAFPELAVDVSKLLLF
ncbi:MAG: Uma2 family endonuclease [Synechococcales cyanobacterium RM1_1_8]|nr:Uma2 family endonuclease [Synechococcales cyanobacterium RM1_1_8]